MLRKRVQALPDVATTQAIALFVDSAGNDANAGTSSGAGACLTIAGALSKLALVKRAVGHAITISVGAGNFAGAIVDGFNFTSGGSLVISGTMANVTPATGTATGTLSSATAGSGGGFSTDWATVTDSTQTWTVNDLRGSWLVTTGGTGAGQTKIIASNTATALTVTGIWTTTPNATTTYAIQRPSTIITTNASFTPWSSTTAVTAGFIFIGNNGSNDHGGTSTGTTAIARSSKLCVQQVKLEVTGRAFRIMGNQTATFRRNWFTAATTVFEGGAHDTLSIYDNYASGTTFNFLGAGQGATSTCTYATSGNVLHGIDFGIQANGGVWQSTADYFFGMTSAVVSLTSLAPANFSFQGCIVDASAGGGTFISGNAAAVGATQVNVISCSVSNCAVGILAAGTNIKVLNTVGTGNTIGLKASNGGRMVINTGTTITGTTEVDVDGVTQTLANFRALTPIAVLNASYGTLLAQL